MSNELDICHDCSRVELSHQDEEILLFAHKFLYDHKKDKTLLSELALIARFIKNILEAE